MNISRASSSDGICLQTEQGLDILDIDLKPDKFKEEVATLDPALCFLDNLCIKLLVESIFQP